MSRHSLPCQSTDFPTWYAEVVSRAGLAEGSLVRGQVIKPYGYAIWEAVQAPKASGHENLYFPLFVPGAVLDREREPAHLGTTDVDILVAFHATPDADLSPLEEALERAGFDPDPKITEGWRWRAKVGFATVKIEFFCDLDDQPVNRAIALPGCKRVMAANLRGAGFVSRTT